MKQILFSPQKILTLFCFLLALGFTNEVKSQTTIYIGANNGANTTTTYPCPLQDFYYSQRAQYLYRQSELTAAGLTNGSVISQIGWVTNATTISGHLQEGYTISLKNTSLANLNTASWETGFTTVYGPTNYSYLSGYAGNVLFNTSSFVYTGGDLVVEVCGGISGGGFTSNPACQWTTGLAGTVSHTYRGDGVNGCGNATTTNTGTITTRPRMVITYFVSSPPTITSFSPGSGCEGSIVTITGTNLTGTTLVQFGGVNATSFTVISPTQIDAVVPTGALAGVITVTNPSGTASSLSNFIPYTLPTVSASASQDTICGGESSTLTATGSGTSYTWNPGALSGASVVVSPVASTTYTVVATNANGCTATSTVSIIVNTIPIIDSVVATPSAICENGTSSLNAYYLTPPIPGAYCNSSISSATFEYITNVNYGGINNTSGGNAGGPVNYLAQTAYVTAGAASPLSVTINPDANEYVFAWIDWNQNGDFTDAGEQYTLAVNVVSPGPYTLSITPPAEAINGNTRMRVMVVYANATPNACVTASFGEAEDYTVNVSGGKTPVASVLWSPATFLNATNLPNVTASNVTATTIYTVTATSATGCTNTSTVQLTVNPFGGVAGPANPELFYYKFDGAGASIPNLALTPPVGTGTATIVGVGLTQGGAGLDGGALLGAGTSSSIDYVNTGWATNMPTTAWTISFWTSGIAPSATLYYIFGDNSAASFRCFTNGVAGANNWMIRATGMADITFTGGATINPHLCTAVYSQALGNIKVYLDGVLINTITQATPPVINGVGPFKVGAYSSNTNLPSGGKLDEFRIYNRALDITEIQELVTLTGGSFTATASPSNICNGDTSTLTASAGATSYTWNPGVLSGQTVQVTPNANTTYTVLATDANGCTATSTTSVSVMSPSLSATATPDTICEMGTSAITTSWLAPVLPPPSYCNSSISSATFEYITNVN
ncbi:MAG TPA: GEVED domain-containing protein, partial [Chitinophagaceae bacterium]|nr:GEVED domain-containing protein [Chitinophagaceae bacterium]